jgi:putative aldouronate transport system substrate-binding protein
MKEKMKVFCVLFLALSLSSFLFATGGQSSGGSSGPVEMTLWYGLSMTEAQPLPTNWIGYQLIEQKLGIKLTANALPSSDVDQNTRITATAASNSLPEIFMVSREPWLSIVRLGLLGQVDDLYAQMPNRTRLMYSAESRNYTTYNGRSYGLAQASAIPKNEGVVIRKDWLDKLGLQVPVTTEDYYNVMRAFTFNDPDGNGRADTYGFGAFIELISYEEGLGRRFEPFMGAFGVAGTWNMSSANGGLNVRKPAMFDALTYVKRLVDERVIDPNWTAYSKDDFRAAWKQGRFGIMREQNAALAAEGNYAPFDQNFPNGEWLVIDPPRGPSGNMSVGVFPNSWRTYAVSARAIQAGKGAAIAKLLEWMVSDEGYYLCGWGERGINYTIGSDGVPTVDGIPDPSKGWSRPEIQSITQLRNMVFYNSEMELVARYPTYRAPTSGKRMSSLDVLFDMQKRAWTPNDGAELMPVPNADLQRFYQQGVIEFVTGVRQLTQANWTAWVAEFDNRLGGLEWERAGLAAATAGGYLK